MSQTTRRSLLKTLGVGGTVFAFGAGAGYAQTGTENGSEDGAGEGVTLPPSSDTALLRALHASPDAPAVDVYVDGEQAAQGVEFGSISGYLELSPGEVEVQVYPSEQGGEGTTGAGAENETTTESGGLGNETTTESGATAGNETGTESEGLGNETTTEGGATAGNETGTESEGLGNETTETGAGATNETGAGAENETGAGATNETGAGATNETTGDAGGLGTENETETGAGSTGQTPSGDPLVDESVSVQGGESYTVAAINQLDDIEALVLEDEPEDDQAQDEEANTAMVRAVNLSPDAGTVKVRADSYVLGGALEYEETSNYADIQTGTSQVNVLPTGSADPVGTANYEFEAGKRYNLFLVGMVDPEAAAAQGGLGTDNGTTTEAGATNETGVGATNETGAGAENETGVGATNETTTESGGLGNETTETGAVENGTGTESGGLGNETTTEAGVGATNETTTESSGLGNETTTESSGLGNETTETGAGATNETGAGATNETGAGATNETATDVGAGGSEGQTQPEAFRILGVQDSTGSVLEEAEEEGTPSADDLLPVDLSDDNESAGNATAENETAANGTAENETVANETTSNATAGNATAENESAANGTATNGTVTEANNTTTSD